MLQGDNVSDLGPSIPVAFSHSLFLESMMSGYRCLDGGCADQPNPWVYRNQQSLRQHQYKKHPDIKEEDTLMGRTLALKRAHEVEVEEARKRQLLEEEIARRTPEPEPPRPVGSNLSQ